MPPKFLLIIHGPMCAGKSTVAKLVSTAFPEVFHISRDRLKWCISDYSAEKYSGSGVVSRMLFALVRQAVQENLSIVVEGDLSVLKNSHEYKEVALKHNLHFLEVVLDAPYEILLERFNARIKAVIEQNSRASVTTVEGMKTRYDTFVEHRNASLPTFDTSVLSPEAIRDEIIHSIHSHAV